MRLNIYIIYYISPSLHSMHVSGLQKAFEIQPVYVIHSKRVSSRLRLYALQQQD